MKPVTLRAFIGRPQGVEPGAVVDYLIAEGVQTDDPRLRVSSGEPPPATLLEAVKHCDVGVIIYAPDSRNLQYELGALDALGKPLIIVADPSHEVPTAYLRYLTVRAPLTGTEELRNAIHKFIAEVRRSRPAKLKRRAPRPLTGAMRKRRNTKRQNTTAFELLRTASPVEVARAVAELLKSAGGFVEAHGYSGDRGADLVLWSAKPNDVLREPLLVEVKAGHLSWQRIRDAETRLQLTVDKSGAIGGLLVYFDSAGKRFEGEHWAPSVRRISFDDLREALSVSSLTAAIRRLLSERVSSADA